MLKTFALAVLWAVLAPAPAEAACAISGTTVTCTDLDADGLIVGNAFIIAVETDAFVQSIYDGETPSSCSEFVAAIRAGDGARITNRGLVLGRGNCGVGIEAGNNLTLTNDGSIATDQDIGYAIVAGTGSTILNNGQIRTVGTEANVIILGNDSRLTNATSGRIGTTGTFAVTLSAGSGVTAINDGRMGAAGLAGTVVELGARSSFTNSGTITANGARAVGLRLFGDGASLTNRGTIVSVPDAPAQIPTSIGVLVEGQNVAIVNEAGTITGASAAIVVTGSATITNRATLRGAATSGIRAEGAGRFTLINTGRVEGDVAIPSGSRLSGTGTIAGNVQSGGIVAPGLSIGTMTIAGSFVQTGSGQLDIEVSGDGTRDRLVIGGPVLSLAGTVAVTFTGAPVRNGQNFTFLTSSGGPLAATRILPQVTDNAPAFLNAQVSFGVNQVGLVVARTPYASAASSASQLSVAQALDVAVGSATAANAALFMALDLGDAAAARATFDQLAPDALGSLTVPAVSGLQTLIESSASAMKTAKPQKEWRAWGTVAHRGSSRTKGIGNKYSSGIDSIAAGADYTFSDGASFGVMIANLSAATKRGRAAAAGRQDNDGYALGITAFGTLGPLTVSGAIGTGDGEVETNRTHTIGGTPATVTAETDTGSTFGFIHADQSFAISATTLTPMVGFEFARASTDTLVESGPFATTVDSHAHKSARSVARLTIDTALGPIRPRASVGWLHEFSDLAPRATARIPSAGVGSFSIAGLAGKRDVIDAEAALVLDVAPGAAISFGFGGSLNDRLHGQAVRAGFSFGW